MTKRLFSNGAQFMDWQASNCERCEKGANVCLQPHEIQTCEIELAIFEACFDTGYVSDEIAERAGYNEETKRDYGWMCNEVVWTEKWKADFERMQGNAN